MPTLSSLKASGATVRWRCQECAATGTADLDRIIAAKGPDYDLTDRTAACPADGCSYWISFYAQQGMRNTPLRTEAGMLREMDRRTEWLRKVGGGSGLRRRKTRRPGEGTTGLNASWGAGRAGKGRTSPGRAV